MTDQRELDTILRGWLHERAAVRPDPYPIVGRVMGDLPTTRQRGRWWPTGTRGGAARGSPLRLAAAAVVGLVVLAVGGPFMLLGQQGVDEPGAVASSSPVAQPSPAFSGRTIVVAQDGSGDVETITDAVERAVDGDRILVRPGWYLESIMISESIEMTGEGDREAIVVEDPLGGPTDPGDNLYWAMRIVGGQPRIANLTLLGSTGYETAIVVAGGAPILEDLVVGSPSRRDTVLFLDGDGILRASLVHGGVGAGGSATVIDNEVLGTASGYDGGAQRIGIGASGSASVIGNTIRGGDVGVRVESDSSLIEGNDIETDRTGIVIDGADAVVRANTIRGGEIGIELWGAAPELTGNDVRDAATGIAVMTGAAPRIEDNRVTASGVGILVDNGRISSDGALDAAVLGDNNVCGNDIDLEVAPDASLLREGNGVCIVAESTAQPQERFGSPVDPLAGLVTEVVEPGVERLIRDAAGNDLTNAGVVGQGVDGTVWMWRGGPVDEWNDGALFVLGRHGTYPTLDVLPFGPQGGVVGPDGMLWVATERGILSFDGTTWTTHRPDVPGDANQVAVADDGTVWGVWVTSDGGSTSVGRLDASGWTTWATGDGPNAIPTPSSWWTHLAVGPEGSAWLAVVPTAEGGTGSLARFDGAGWEVSDLPGSLMDLADGPDGTLWAAMDRNRIARYDGTWTIVSDEAPTMGRDQMFTGDMEVTSDGTVWMSVGAGARGLARFDGRSWTTMLAGRDNFDNDSQLDAGPDGTLWAHGSNTDDAYLIRPATDGGAHGISPQR